MAAPLHPLDHLTPAEHWKVYNTLRASGRTDTTLAIAYVALREPPKAEVLAWSEGQPFRREAFVHFIQGGSGHEVLIDLTAGQILKWSDSPGQKYMWHSGDESTVSRLMLGHPEVQAALRRRGANDFTHIHCGGANEGYFDLPEERGNRVVRATCSNGTGQFSGYGASYEGLVGVVDLTAKKVLRVIDGDSIPLASDGGEYGPDVVGPVRDMKTPIAVVQPMGPSFTLNGQSVSWQNWRFHFRIDPRRGLVVSLVKWADDTSERAVMYQGSISELFVPYSSPEERWNYQAYFDLGSYANVFGGVANTLEPGADCPDYATYFDAVVSTESGRPVQRVRAACLFERLTGDPAWRHTRGGRITDSRPRRDLVLRMFMTAGNYDYLFDYVFMEDGTLEIRVGASGMDQTRTVRAANAVEARTAAERTGAPREDLHGRFIAPNLVGVNHSHFFSFRLDLDIDGPANSVAVDRLVTERMPKGSARTSLWNYITDIAQREGDAQRRSTIDKPEVWRITNPNRAGPYGDPVSYEIAGGHQAVTLLSDDDFIRRRAGFTEHTLWVTPYVADELFAAGDYPTAHLPGQGLPAWTSGNRPIANTDLVVWYTVGFHHIPRPEDWPIMPVAWHSFVLKPTGFFKRNPALDLPKPR
jgi:primary-amine oxidase